MEELLRIQLQKYPHMQAEDALLLLFQSAGGQRPQGLEYDLAEEIEQEGNGLFPEQLLAPYYEKIGGGYCRMNLSVLQVLPAELLARMALQSRPAWDEAVFQKGLRCLKKLCSEGKTEFSGDRVNKLLQEDYVNSAPKRHSMSYSRAYTPAYRVVREEYGKYLDVFIRVSRLLYRGGEVTVAIDGPSGAGKTTLAMLLVCLFGGNHFCTEEFVRGGRFLCDSFREQVLEQLNTGRAFVYESQDPLRQVEVFPKRLNVVEGLYSMYPALEKYYELKIFLGVTPLTQTMRILEDRGEDGFSRFARERAPRESAYLQNQQTELKCDFVFTA